LILRMTQGSYVNDCQILKLTENSMGDNLVSEIANQMMSNFTQPVKNEVSK
jgi:hypothetical protein